MYWGWFYPPKQGHNVPCPSHKVVWLLSTILTPADQDLLDNGHKQRVVNIQRMFLDKQIILEVAQYTYRYPPVQGHNVPCASHTGVSDCPVPTTTNTCWPGFAGKWSTSREWSIYRGSAHLYPPVQGHNVPCPSHNVVWPLSTTLTPADLDYLDNGILDNWTSKVCMVKSRSNMLFLGHWSMRWRQLAFKSIYGLRLDFLETSE